MYYSSKSHINIGCSIVITILGNFLMSCHCASVVQFINGLLNSKYRTEDTETLVLVFSSNLFNCRLNSIQGKVDV